MKYLLLALTILTQCAWSWPQGWQQSPSVTSLVATTNITLTSSQMGQVIVFNNSTGVAANGTQFTLPSAIIGMQYTLVADTAKWIYIQPASADTINIASTVIGTRINNRTTAAIGDSITLVCATNNTWSIQAKSGTWASGN